MTSPFPQPYASKAENEEGAIFAPRFDASGLVTAVVTDASDGELLMVAHMNAHALRLTLETGIAHYWSRSRGELWKKGETSGNLQTVVEIRTDCDQDAVWLKVNVAGHGATCHTGRRSCFYRVVSLENGQAVLLKDKQEPHVHLSSADQKIV
ncbi:phosphoribosyl-AMP cyclohydrolase [Phyllobacterium salinisoli]|uniref:Phosphoribosyl-AMP cyclohydrolase n=1 Tax=Phyllobacterium salinisoli TaxID=1899321 RepID=A0A368K7L7_9HYPH|nr:phosphoribosyl-AMP cyclohydrolase [Phyllobacterium salinisoli]RCS24372.1 phosphoribosyl-AMP cyclohydrolase [Phyllobacterium salinisoli]